MAGRFPHPKFQAIVAGVALPGAKLYIYENGTTTKVGAGVALDARSGSDVDNPLIMDANGEADLWLKPGSQYTLKLDNSSDVQQWSIDGVSANDLETWIASGSDISYQAGNVGIGGDAGTETLLVTGSCKITSTLEGETVTINRGLTVNDDGAYDTRIESNNSEYIVNVNSSADQVGIGGTTSDSNAGALVVNTTSVVINQDLSLINSDFSMNGDLDIQSGDLDIQNGNFILTGNFTMDNTGATFGLPTGNALDPAGTATLNGTTGVTINNTNIGAQDQIQISRVSTSSAYGDIYSTISAGSSFTIYSTNASDDGGVSYFIIKNTT
jgi:hypothetical protein